MIIIIESLFESGRGLDEVSLGYTGKGKATTNIKLYIQSLQSQHNLITLITFSNPFSPEFAQQMHPEINKLLFQHNPNKTGTYLRVSTQGEKIAGESENPWLTMSTMGIQSTTTEKVENEVLSMTEYLYRVADQVVCFCLEEMKKLMMVSPIDSKQPSSLNCISAYLIGTNTPLLLFDTVQRQHQPLPPKHLHQQALQKRE